MYLEKTVSIAVMDIFPIVRHGIINIINSLEGYDVVLEASREEELLEKIERSDQLPDICVLDINNGANSIFMLREIKRKMPSMKILVFSSLYDDYMILEMLRSGANGFLGKNCDTRQFVKALASVYYSDYYYSQSIAKKIFTMHQHNSPMLPKITDREMTFLCHCCSELSYKEIGDLMSVSVRTVEAFRDALFTKLNIKSRTGLVIFALQNGLVSLNNRNEC